MPTQKKTNQKEKQSQNRIEFVRFKNPDDGLYYYRYDDEKNKTFIISATGYTSSRSRDKGIERLKSNISYCKVSKEKQQYFFVIKSLGNNAELAKSKGFSTKKAAEEAYEWLKERLTSPESKKQPKATEATPKKAAAVTSKSGTNPRYAFRLTFYPEGDNNELRGNIEYVLGEKKNTFQGLDIDAIHEFLKENLPAFEENVLTLSQEKETEQEETTTTELESLQLKFIEEGQPLSSSTISSHKSIEAQIELLHQAETLPQQGDYEVFLVAKSLQTGKQTLAGKTKGSFPNQEQLKFPVLVNSLNPGPYQILSSLKWYNKGEDAKNIHENSVNGSCYVMVY